MLIIDIRHWLNETMTGPAIPKLKNKVDKLGEIISFVTDLDERHPAPKCSRRPKRKPCPGILDVIVTEDLRIHWYCPVCQDEGIISGWSGLLWDMLQKEDTLH